MREGVTGESDEAMYPIQHPGTILLIHNEMVRHEMDRNGYTDRQENDRPRPRPGDGIRIVIGRTLIALGTRIEPEREHHDQPVPAGGLR